MLLVTHGLHSVGTLALRGSRRREFKIPSQVTLTSLIAGTSAFVCGDEDFKMYKFEFETGTELESFKGLLGSVHCVSFSPDGELYAKAREYRALRLWQTTVGKTC
ncbi:hypothetical protein HPB48_013186 [Haemaphysalis longicornis]|uniref:Serine-threonine kinase receptor-associated protein n=1 Tax=Haemaphysalis longicornis TaxID=44386 RepID=A0A9J6F795_HAELO|nr:hypothetical protein HPB48_013186 [Haemaphysalis longicornis]